MGPKKALPMSKIIKRTINTGTDNESRFSNCFVHQNQSGSHEKNLSIIVLLIDSPPSLAQQYLSR
jgi:hypothetical protein